MCWGKCIVRDKGGERKVLGLLKCQFVKCSSSVQAACVAAVHNCHLNIYFSKHLRGVMCTFFMCN